jgi:hypothetical protein
MRKKNDKVYSNQRYINISFILSFQYCRLYSVYCEEKAQGDKPGIQTSHTYLYHMIMAKCSLLQTHINLY